MNIAVLIPWRGGDAHRERLFEYILPRWQSTGVEVCVGVDDPGRPFNCSRAINRAFKQAKADCFAVFGADYLPMPETVEKTRWTLRSQPWVPMLSRTGYYSAASTEEILTGRDPGELNLEYELPFATSMIAFTRSAFVESGGMDERFEGWGFEDAAHRQTLIGLYGDYPALPFTSRTLWHPGDHRVTEGPNFDLMQDYLKLTDPASTRAYLSERGSFLDA